MNIRRGYLDSAAGQVHYRFCGPRGAVGATAPASATAAVGASGAARTRPLLLLHPSPLSGYVFEVFMRDMARDRWVIAVDTPGYGMSDAPVAPPRIEDYAGTMLEVLAGLGLADVDVLGYHTGSLTAIEMARRQPTVIRHLVLVGLALFTAQENREWRARYAPRPAHDVPAALAARWPVFRTQAWAMLRDDARALNILLDSGRNAERATWGFDAAFAYPLAERLPEVVQPTLVLCPEDDLWDYTRRAAPLLRNGRVHELPGWGHGFLDSESASIAGLVGAFLAECAVPGQSG